MRIGEQSASISSSSSPFQSRAEGGARGVRPDRADGASGVQGTDKEKDKDDPVGPKKLTADQQDEVRKLQARDAQVRAHEAAHQAAARGAGGAASFTYQTGPDGKRYAIGGEVPVAIRSGRTPDETIANAQVVRAAALAPADPSAQDMAVAAEAAQMEAQARQQKAQTSTRESAHDDPLMIASSLRSERGDGAEGPRAGGAAAGAGAGPGARNGDLSGLGHRAIGRYAATR